MGKETINRKKIIEEMKQLKSKRITEVIETNKQNGIKTDLAKLESQITIKYLGKIELVNEAGEIVEKDVFLSLEELNGQMIIRYYDESQRMLAIQLTEEGEIMPSEQLAKSLTEHSPKEEKEKAGKTLNNLKEADKEKAKTQEELEEEQKQIDIKGPQLTKEDVNRLNGPTIALDQQVDNMTLGNKLNIEGKYIKFVDIDQAKKLIPDLDIDELGQEFLPIEIAADGTANAISEDIMRFSTLKGSNSTERSITENNDGTRALDQSIVTFEIPGTHNYISVGFNEQHVIDPYYEVRFQTIDRDSNKMGGEELKQEDIGTIEDPTAHNERRINTEGQLKYTKELVTEEQAEKYAKSAGIFEEGRKLDIDRARKELEYLATGGKSVEEIVQEAEEEQRVPGPLDSEMPH